jgi:hypothetical protein
MRDDKIMPSRREKSGIDKHDADGPKPKSDKGSVDPKIPGSVGEFNAKRQADIKGRMKEMHKEKKN